MKIAILAWGSLLWEPRNLALETDWELGGPELPLEFSRVSTSRNGVLTLAIDPKNGVKFPTYFAISVYTELNNAINNLIEREGTILKRIGYVDCKSGNSHSIAFPAGIREIRNWVDNKGFGAVIWADFPSNFNEIDKTRFSNIDNGYMEFTIENAQLYLHGMKPPYDEKAREYIKNAPPEINTELRKRMNRDQWFSQVGRSLSNS